MKCFTVPIITEGTVLSPQHPIKISSLSCVCPAVGGVSARGQPAAAQDPVLHVSVPGTRLCRPVPATQPPQTCGWQWLLHHNNPPHRWAQPHALPGWINPVLDCMAVDKSVWVQSLFRGFSPELHGDKMVRNMISILPGYWTIWGPDLKMVIYRVARYFIHGIILIKHI